MWGGVTVEDFYIFNFINFILFFGPYINSILTTSAFNYHITVQINRKSEIEQLGADLGHM